MPEFESTNFSYKLPTDQTAERTQYVSAYKIKWQQGIGDFPIFRLCSAVTTNFAVDRKRKGQSRMWEKICDVLFT